MDKMGQQTLCDLFLYIAILNRPASREPSKSLDHTHVTFPLIAILRRIPLETRALFSVSHVLDQRWANFRKGANSNCRFSALTIRAALTIHSTLPLAGGRDGGLMDICAPMCFAHRSRCLARLACGPMFDSPWPEKQGIHRPEESCQ